MNDLNDLEQQVILSALDCFIRIHLGQIPAALDSLHDHLFRPTEEARDAFAGEYSDSHEIRRRAEEFQQYLTGSPHGGPGLYHPGVSNLGRLAKRLETKLRIEWHKRLPVTHDITLSMINEKGEAT